MPRKHTNEDQPAPATTACQRLQDQLHREWATRRGKFTAQRERDRIDRIAQEFRTTYGNN